jgi:hypothetical protein
VKLVVSDPLLRRIRKRPPADLSVIEVRDILRPRRVISTPLHIAGVLRQALELTRRHGVSFQTTPTGGSQIAGGGPGVVFPHRSGRSTPSLSGPRKNVKSAGARSYFNDHVVGWTPSFAVRWARYSTAPALAHAAQIPVRSHGYLQLVRYLRVPFACDQNG